MVWGNEEEGAHRRERRSRGQGMLQLIEAQPRVLGFRPSWAADSLWALNLLWTTSPAPKSLQGLVVLVQLQRWGPVGWREALPGYEQEGREVGWSGREQ